MKYCTALLFQALCLLTFPRFTPAGVLFFDGFESPAETVGNFPTLWTPSPSDNTRINVSVSEAKSGSNSLFMRHSGTRSITQISAIDTTGTGGLVVSWWRHQGTNAWETDSFTFSMDFGSGFQTVLTDEGLADGGDFTFSGISNTLPSASGLAPSFQEYTVTIDSSYYEDGLNPTSVKLKFGHVTGSTNENTYLDDIMITSIPEPGAITLLLIGLAGMRIGRRKR